MFAEKLINCIVIVVTNVIIAQSMTVGLLPVS